MMDFLLSLLQAVILAVVPVAGGFLVNYLRKASQQVTEDTNSNIIAKYVQEAADAVADAVLCVSQTYVDTLKKTGSFDVEEQKIALSLAKDRAVSLMSADARLILKKLYGDVDKWLESKIEATIMDVKLTTKLSG